MYNALVFGLESRIPVNLGKVELESVYTLFLFRDEVLLAGKYFFKNK